MLENVKLNSPQCFIGFSCDVVSKDSNSNDIEAFHISLRSLCLGDCFLKKFWRKFFISCSTYVKVELTSLFPDVLFVFGIFLLLQRSSSRRLLMVKSLCLCTCNNNSNSCSSRVLYFVCREGYYFSSLTLSSCLISESETVISFRKHFETHKVLRRDLIHNPIQVHFPDSLESVLSSIHSWSRRRRRVTGRVTSCSLVKHSLLLVHVWLLLQHSHWVTAHIYWQLIAILLLLFLQKTFCLWVTDSCLL